MKVSEIKQKDLIELFKYDPETGCFSRIRKTSPNCKLGPVTRSDDKGYYKTWFAGKVRSVHQLIFIYMEGRPPKNAIDHINGDPQDNRWENLREVSHAENMRNMKLQKSNTSGVSGVAWNKNAKKWQVQINHPPGNQKYIGVFACYEDAVRARKKAEIEFNYHANHGRTV